MAAAVIVINQSGKPAGTAGISRRDLAVGSLVTLTNDNDTGVRAWAWQILDQPDQAAPVSLSNPNAASATFTPNAVGTYRIRLTVNEGLKGEVQTRLGAILTAGGDRFPAAGEQGDEVNWTDPDSGSASVRGWARDTNELLKRAGNGTLKTHADPTSDSDTGLKEFTNFVQTATINGTKDVFTMLPDPGFDEAGLYEFVFTATLNGTANISHTRLFKLHARWVGGSASTATLQTASVVSGGATFTITVGITSQAFVLTLTDGAGAPQTVNVIGDWRRIRHNESITP